MVPLRKSIDEFQDPGPELGRRLAPWRREPVEAQERLLDLGWAFVPRLALEVPEVQLSEAWVGDRAPDSEAGGLRRSEEVRAPAAYEARTDQLLAEPLRLVSPGLVQRDVSPSNEPPGLAPVGGPVASQPQPHGYLHHAGDGQPPVTAAAPKSSNKISAVC